LPKGWFCDLGTESRCHGGMQWSEALAALASNLFFFLFFDCAQFKNKKDRGL
jgi:hypothetical protein